MHHRVRRRLSRANGLVHVGGVVGVAEPHLRLVDAVRVAPDPVVPPEVQVLGMIIIPETGQRPVVGNASASGARRQRELDRVDVPSGQREARATALEGDPELDRTIFVSAWPRTPGDTSHTHVLGLVSMADFAFRPEIHARIEQALDTCTASFGATYDIDYTFSNPPLRNDRALIDKIIPALEQALGSSAVLRFWAPYPFAHEDFVHYAERVPAAFLWLGTQNLEKGIPSILHTPDYDVDEDALVTGVTAMAAVVKLLMKTPRR